VWVVTFRFLFAWASVIAVKRIASCFLSVIDG
jgi:hypothetical protein